MNILAINAKLKQLVKTERKITYEILLLVQTLDVTKSYRELGYSSLFEYLTKEIGYSEGAAQRRISSARLIKECPKIEEDLKTGTLNLTQVSLAQVAIRQEERAESAKISVQRKTEIVEKLRNKNTFETKKILKQELPAFELPISKVNPSNNGKVHVTLEFDEKDWTEVQSLLARMSHKVPSQKLEDLLLYWQTQLKAKDQKNAEQGSEQKKQWNGKNNKQENKQIEKQKMELAKTQTLPPLRRWNRQYISIHTKRDLQRNSQNQCEYISKITGKRCESKHFLEIDHNIPLAAGGSNRQNNLRILCRAHNQQAAKDWQLSF